MELLTTEIVSVNHNLSSKYKPPSSVLFFFFKSLLTAFLKQGVDTICILLLAQWKQMCFSQMLGSTVSYV